MKSTTKLLLILLITGLGAVLISLHNGTLRLPKNGALTKITQIFSKKDKELFESVKDLLPAVVLIHSFSDRATKNHLIYNSALHPRETAEDYDHSVTNGVIVHKNGYVVTPYDTLKHSSRIIVSINSENKKNNVNSTMIITDDDYEAKIVKEIPELNITILKLDGKAGEVFQYVEIGSTFEYNRHAKSKRSTGAAVAIGKARGANFVTRNKFANTLNSFGVVASPIENMFIEKIDGAEYIVLDNKVSGSCMSPENAGGAIIDKSGKLIGIPDYVKSSSMFFTKYVAIPANVIKKAMYVAVPAVFNDTHELKFGITFVDLPKGEKGVRIETVEKGSRADAAGLLQSDIVRKINNEPVTNANTFKNLLDRSIWDGSVFLTIEREGNLIEIEVL
jgi:putative serine protease PepD